MNCLLPIIAGFCLSDPAALNLYADASMQSSGDFRYVDHGVNYRGGQVGRIGIEMQSSSIYGFRLRYGYEHSSLLNTNADRGQERIFFGFTYRPFGGAL